METAGRSPVFFYLALGLFVTLLLLGAAIVAYYVWGVNDPEGYALLFFGGLFLAVAVVVFGVCLVLLGISIARHEPYRRLSIALVAVSCLAVWTFRGVAYRFSRGVLHMRKSAKGSRHSTPSAASGVTAADIAARSSRWKTGHGVSDFLWLVENALPIGSSQVEVKALLGDPLNEVKLANGGVGWLYVKNEASRRQFESFSIVFDKNGKFVVMGRKPIR